MTHSRDPSEQVREKREAKPSETALGISVVFIYIVFINGEFDLHTDFVLDLFLCYVHECFAYMYVCHVRIYVPIEVRRGH